MTAFPLLANRVPHEHFRSPGLPRRLCAEPPHWFYHLRAWPPDHPLPDTGFAPAARDWLDRLASLLGLAPLYQIEAQEYVPRPLRAGEQSELAFPREQVFEGTSWSLALAVALAEAATGCTVPPWVTCSGCLPDHLGPSLALERTTRIANKVRLCLGREDDFDIRYLIGRLYQHPNTPRALGPQEQRTVSGEVRLLIIPTEVEDWSDEDRRQLGYEASPLRLSQLNLSDLDELKGWIEAITRGGMLIVQVPTVWEALRLLRFDRGGPIARALAGDHHPNRLNECLLFVPRHNGSGSVASQQAYRQRLREQALWELDHRLETLPGPYARLQAVVEQCVRRLKCDSGNIRRLSVDPDWLDDAARVGKAFRVLLQSIPAHVGVTGWVLSHGQADVVTTRQEVAQRCAYQGTAGRGVALEDRYDAQQCEAYRDLLAHIGACVALPLRSPERIIGVLCLHRDREGPFDQDDLHVVEAIAERGAALLVDRLNEEEEARRWTTADLVGQLAALDREAADRPLGEACALFGRHLAVRAMELSGAYRTTVRLLNHDGQSLVVIGLAGESDWPVEFPQREFPRHAHSAYNHALNQNRTILIPDTTSRAIQVPFEEVNPPAAAHIAVVLRNGPNLIGVLSVDFKADHRDRCNEAMARHLEELAGAYAGYLRGFSSAQLFVELEGCLPAGAPDANLSALAPWLRGVGQALGVTCGSLFLRKADTGRYQLVAGLEDPDGPGPNCAYAPGEGRTGWVIGNRRTLRIADCDDRRALGAINPRLRPSSHPDCYDPGAERLAYLGVPVLVGSDVQAMLRFICRTPKPSPCAGQPRPTKTHFTALDQQLAQAAAAHLGPWLLARQQGRRHRALGALTRRVFDARSRLDVCQAAYEALRVVCGDCRCLIRVVDGYETEEGARPVLDRLYLSDDTHDWWPQVREMGQGLAGRVWEQGKTLSSQDIHNDPALAQRRAEVLPAEKWWEQNGCLVIAPLLIEGQVTGTLGIHRTTPGTLLEADVPFIESVAELTAQALRNLADTEERQIQEALLWAVHTRVLRAVDPHVSEGPELLLLHDVCQAVKTGLGAAHCFAWRYDDQCHHYESVGGEAPLSYADVQAELADNNCVVVTAPERDPRLRRLLSALPKEVREEAIQCQHAAFLVQRSEAWRLIPRPVFLAVVHPPQRLSRAQAQTILQMLVTTLVSERRGAGHG